MDSLTPAEWSVVGPVIDQRAETLASLINSGSRVHEVGFLTNTVNAVMKALNEHRAAEDAAWNEHEARKGHADYHMI